MNRTKIICTAGPSVDTQDKMERLIKMGMSMIRLNCSHGTEQTRDAYLKNIRRAEKSQNQSLAVMLDLQGPKIRVGKLPQTFELIKGETWKLLIGTLASVEKKIIPISYKKICDAVAVGDRLFLDDGLIQTVVKSKTKSDVTLEVLHGGFLDSHKGLNIPNYRVNDVGLSAKDKQDLLWGIKNDVDFVALSFVRSAHEISQLRQWIKKRNPNSEIQIIAKIEKPEAVQNMDEIIKISDGILVARGDLGIELKPERVPVVQKTLIEKCRFYRKPVIVATQMLDSMRSNPLPTRAEVSDVASAIYAGTDAVLLTGETASGKFPIEACRMMRKIITEVEEHLIVKSFRKSPEDFGIEDSSSAFMFNVMQLADDMKAKAIVMLTRRGNLTKTLAKFHPKQVIFSMADNVTAYRQLNLLWGVFPVHVSASKTQTRVESALARLKKDGIALKGDRFIIVFRDFKTDYLSLKVVEL